MFRAFAFAALSALVAVGCQADGEQAASQPRMRPESTTATPGAVKYAEPTIGLRFTYPDTGLRVAVQHFDPATPPGKFKHEVTLWALGAQAVTVDVWDNTERLSLQDWFEKYLAFTRKAGTVQSGTAAQGRVPAVVVHQPRSPQAQSKRIVVFAQGDRVFRVTCHDADDPVSEQAHRQVLDTFEGQVTP